MKKPSNKKNPLDRRGGAREGAGRPAYEPTDRDRNTVMALVAAGMNQEGIARCVGGPEGMNVSTLQKYYGPELAKGRDVMLQVALGALITKIQSGDLGAICFFLKTRYPQQFTERTRNEVYTPAGESLHVTAGSERESLAARIAGIAARTGANPVSGDAV